MRVDTALGSSTGSPLPMCPCSPQGAGDVAVQMQCDHLKGRWLSHMLWDVYYGRGSYAHPTALSLGLQLSQGRTTNPAWASS